MSVELAEKLLAHTALMPALLSLPDGSRIPHPLVASHSSRFLRCSNEAITALFEYLRTTVQADISSKDWPTYVAKTMRFKLGQGGRIPSALRDVSMLSDSEFKSQTAEMFARSPITTSKSGSVGVDMKVFQHASPSAYATVQLGSVWPALTKSERAPPTTRRMMTLRGRLDKADRLSVYCAYALNRLGDAVSATPTAQAVQSCGNLLRKSEMDIICPVGLIQGPSSVEVEDSISCSFVFGEASQEKGLVVTREMVSTLPEEWTSQIIDGEKTDITDGLVTAMKDSAFKFGSNVWVRVPLASGVMVEIAVPPLTFMRMRQLLGKESVSMEVKVDTTFALQAQVSYSTVCSCRLVCLRSNTGDAVDSDSIAAEMCKASAASAAIDAAHTLRAIEGGAPVSNRTKNASASTLLALTEGETYRAVSPVADEPVLDDSLSPGPKTSRVEQTPGTKRVADAEDRSSVDDDRISHVKQAQKPRKEGDTKTSKAKSKLRRHEDEDVVA